MTAPRPRASVVIPTHERPEHLARCLESLCGLDYPRDRFEVLVVDDGSDSPPVRAVERAARSIDVRLIERPHGGPAAARNAGAEAASGEVLAFTDDDCAPEADWLATLVGQVAPEPPRAAGGRTLNALVANPFSSTSQMLVDYIHEYCNHDPRRARFLPSNNIAFPRETFLAIGGFDASFRRPAAEDRDLCARWRARDHEMVYAPGAVVRHHHQLALRSFLRQHFDYGRGAYDFRRRRSGTEESESMREPLSFYLDLVRFPFRRLPLPRALVRSLLMGLTQLATASGYFYERARSRS